jgi:hypothetical protein
MERSPSLTIDYTLTAAPPESRGTAAVTPIQGYDYFVARTQGCTLGYGMSPVPGYEPGADRWP